ncbi:hypothetical protein B0H14DRAFT_2593487 [Mycena olivaceomarginata]|nr:hypothetical protein B0H14DRAFT_2593487 [Mycena olivaceomarginata]
MSINVDTGCRYPSIRTRGFEPRTAGGTHEIRLSVPHTTPDLLVYFVPVKVKVEMRQQARKSKENVQYLKSIPHNPESVGRSPSRFGGRTPPFSSPFGEPRDEFRITGGTSAERTNEYRGTYADELPIRAAADGPALVKLAARERGLDGAQDALVVRRDATVDLALLESERCNLRGKRNKGEGLGNSAQPSATYSVTDERKSEALPHPATIFQPGRPPNNIWPQLSEG